MSDASRLTRQIYLTKPSGLGYSHFTPSSGDLSAIGLVINDAVVGSAYAAALSYAEAISGLQKGAVSWSIVKLYYSCFYSLRAMLYLNRIVPFHCDSQMILDLPGAKFLKGGGSSHHWNWVSFRKISSLSSCWYISSDSQSSYEKLREYRENVNYTHEFTDPNFHGCLIAEEKDLIKRIRAYRDDGSFLYTYLADHLAVAYPTKLIFSLDAEMKNASVSLPPESTSYLNKLWVIKDRCPLTN